MKPGIYRDLDEEKYHADPVPEGSLSVSGAKKLLDSPARFKWEQEHREPKKAFDFGHAAHAKVLGKGLPVAVIPDELLSSNGAASTTAAKAFVAEARERGDVPLKSDEAAVIDAMAAKLAEHASASKLLAAGEAERSMFWRDEETRIMLRGRTDWITALPTGRPCIVDYKTTARSANPDRFRWEARDYDYHMQDCHYREGLDALTGDRHAFLFIVQEKTAPYLVSVVELDDDARDVGDQRNRVARRLYLDCRTRDQWPAFPGITRINLPNAKYAPEGITQ